jgi:hypothetical protein
MAVRSAWFAGSKAWLLNGTGAMVLQADRAKAAMAMAMGFIWKWRFSAGVVKVEFN